MAMCKSIVWSGIWFATLLCALNVGVSCLPRPSCPAECTCFYQNSKLITDCSEAEFTTIHAGGLSRDTAVYILNGNQIKNIDTSLAANSSDYYYTNLRWLKLSRNLLTRIQPEMFTGLYLTELDVSSNFIRYIDPETFVNMNTLYFLLLKDNPLEAVEGPFIESSSIYGLYLENCNITDLSHEFFTKLGALKIVDLSGNPLQIIKPGIFNSLQNLDTLNLNYCNLTYIYPEAFKGLVNLVILEIDGNNFANYVDWSLVLRPLTKLMHFHSVKSGLVNLDEKTFFHNNYMRTMSLAENDISNLNLSSLTVYTPDLLYLNISYCNIKGPFAEDTFLNIKELLILKLSGNRIFNSHLAMAISPLTKLLSLSLRDSGLIMLPKNTFNKMTSLNTLDISRNPWNTALTELFLSPLTSLEKLYLGYSELKIIKNTMFSKLSKLKTLSLSGNKIMSIEKGFFENHKSLEVLELNDCGLENLIPTIFYDEDEPVNLRELDISENPLKMPVKGSILPSNLPNLISLDMSKCNLTFVSPDFFTSTPNIKKLFLNNNNIRNYEHSLRFMDILYDIELLDLSFNGIKSIFPSQLTHNDRLTSLRLYRAIHNND